ncbi:hypothetical protein F4780DRAFT_750298 [Xylariomycetidae sp. FL0641]|nr:hypothetical protein F4780DRAFT_750298 [Xylariomycetidae sp. FL0641]
MTSMADTPSPATTPRYSRAGGFLPSTSLPSPAPSTASSRVAAGLPHPRSKPLAPGSRKEDYARDYVSRRLLHISRRYVKKHGIPDPADELSGYAGFDEACRDLEEVLDVLWFSGTPGLQIPYLLNVASAVNDYLPAFRPPCPRPTFALLRKLDHCFASLLCGRDVQSREPLPGFAGRGPQAGFSRTDMVRLKSMADETRMLVAVVMSNEADVEDVESDDDVEKRRPASKPEKEFATTVFNGVDPVKVEDMDDDDNDDESDLEFEDVVSVASSTKQKAADDDDDAMDIDEDEPEDHKPIKVEGNATTSTLGMDNMRISDTITEEADGTDAAPSTGQFQWSLDNSDSDDEELPNTTATTPAADTTEDYDIDEDEVDEEEEELHLNVAKVYEKTLTQLGMMLGESLIDE